MLSKNGAPNKRIGRERVAALLTLVGPLVFGPPVDVEERAINHDIDFCAENFKRIIAMGNGTVLLDGAPRDVLAQEATLAATYVDPPQLTRLGRRLGFPSAVCTEDEFFEAYRQWYTFGKRK